MASITARVPKMSSFLSIIGAFINQIDREGTTNRAKCQISTREVDKYMNSSPFFLIKSNNTKKCTTFAPKYARKRTALMSENNNIEAKHYKI